MCIVYIYISIYIMYICYIERHIYRINDSEFKIYRKSLLRKWKITLLNVEPLNIISVNTDTS